MSQNLFFLLKTSGGMLQHPTPIIIIIIIIHSLELFTSALADGFSLESEW